MAGQAVRSPGRGADFRPQRHRERFRDVVDLLPAAAVGKDGVGKAVAARALGAGSRQFRSGVSRAGGEVVAGQPAGAAEQGQRKGDAAILVPDRLVLGQPGVEQRESSGSVAGVDEAERMGGGGRLLCPPV